MKTHKDLIFVTVPKDARDFIIDNPSPILTTLSYRNIGANPILQTEHIGSFHPHRLPKILGIASELTEKQWAGIVDKQEDEKLYRDYQESGLKHHVFICDTATESGYSLLKSLGFNVEYLEKPIFVMPEITDADIIKNQKCFKLMGKYDELVSQQDRILVIKTKE